VKGADGSAGAILALGLAAAAVPATSHAIAPTGDGTRIAAVNPSIAQAAKKKLKTAKPTIQGTAKVGAKLKGVTGKWGPGKVTFKYQWLVNGKAIKKATKKAYTVQAADAGKKISVKVTGSKKGYKTVKKTSAAEKIPASAGATDTTGPDTSTPAPDTNATPIPTPTSAVPATVVPPAATVGSDGTVRAGWAALFNGTPNPKVERFRRSGAWVVALSPTTASEDRTGRLTRKSGDHKLVTRGFRRRG
jgi:hypothetical protein